MFRAAATSSFEKIFLFSVIALSSLLYPYFFYWYLHTACVTVAHAIFQPNVPPGPWRAVFLFCLRHICGSKSFSAWPSARCFCSSSRLRFLSRYIQRGRMRGTDVSNIRHKLPITPSAASIGPSLCHCARRCSKRCANSFPSCAALRSSSSAFAQSLGTPFPRMYSFPNWYFAQGAADLRTYTSDACADSAKSRAADPASTARPFPFRKYFASLYLANPFPCSAARSNQSAAFVSSKNGDVSSACSFPSAYSAK